LGILGIFSPSLPLSIEEINNFGLTFHYELFTHPYINDEVLTKVFGIHSAYVKEHFLINKSYNLYELRNDFNNQIKIRDYFKDNFDENSLWIRDGLYRLISNVLFIEDPYTKGVFHPRFAVYNEPVYEILSPEEKDSYMRIYNNYFYERHNDYWYNIALQKLSEVFSKTRMLICGEDLGILPKCVAPALERMRIFSLCIQSMPKTHGNEFAHLEANIKQSVATITTHDMPTMRLWWEENYPRTQRFYSTMLQKQGNAPIHLSSTIAEEIIMRHLYCPSMICALSIQDWLSMDNELRNKDIYAERINSPSDIYNRWKYRMNVTIESLMNSEHFNKKIKMMIKRSRR
jgi:4-alpha-glucanotransferase